MFRRKNKQATKIAVRNLSELDTTLRKGKTVTWVNLEKLKISSRKRCLLSPEKTENNDVFVFDSLSAILKLERREDEPKSTAHEQRFFRGRWRVLKLESEAHKYEKNQQTEDTGNFG